MRGGDYEALDDRGAEMTQPQPTKDGTCPHCGKRFDLASLETMYGGRDKPVLGKCATCLRPITITTTRRVETTITISPRNP